MSGSDAQPFSMTTVRIPSATAGWTLDAWKFVPAKGPRPSPVIVMAHGFSANKLMALGEYAEAFARAGYASVVFDYRRWGSSDGSPRHCLFVSEQLEDYRSAIKWARQQPEFDAQRVAVWGTSFSGGHAVTLASESKLNLVAALGQCAYTGNSPFTLSFSVVKSLLLAVVDLLKQVVGLSPVYIPAAAQPGEVGILTAPGSVEGLFGIVRETRDYPNQIAASSIFEVPFYRPDATAHKIACPLLLVIPREDALCIPEGAVAVIGKAPRGESVRTEGGHFDVYPGGLSHSKSLEAQLAFLAKHVPV